MSCVGTDEYSYGEFVSQMEDDTWNPDEDRDFLFKIYGEEQ